MKDSSVIVQVNTVAAPYSSVGSIVQPIAEAINRASMKSVIIAGYGKSCHADYTLENKLEYYINTISARMHGNDGFSALRQAKRLQTILQEINPDLVHLHNLHGYYTNIPLLADTLLQMRVPVVITAHDFRLCTGRCATPGNCQLWRTLDCHKCQFFRYYPASWAKGVAHYPAEYLGRLNAHIVTPSDLAANIFRNSTFAHLPLTVIPNGIDRNIFKPSTIHKKEGYGLQLIAVASRWYPLKNPRALAQLSRQIPEDWSLTIVGADASKYFKGCGANVRLVGHIKNKRQLATLYNEADVLLNASKSETFGLTTHEAQACGLPSVINSKGLIPAHGASVAVDFDNTLAVISAIKKASQLKVDPTGVPSVDDMTAAYIRLYKQILNV